LDPNYALAHAARSLAHYTVAMAWAKGPAIQDHLTAAQADADKAVALAPNLGEGHLALACLAELSLEFTRELEEYERALNLAPSNARILRDYGPFAVVMGRAEAGLDASRRAVALDPLNPANDSDLGWSLLLAGRFSEALAVLTHSQALAPNDTSAKPWIGFAYWGLGDFQKARLACESGLAGGADDFDNLVCLAIAYDKLGRHADAQAMLPKMAASWRGAGTIAVFYAMVYTQW